MPYVLSGRSRRELEGVHPDLVAVVVDALRRSPQDFMVHDGLRSMEEQRVMVARGASKTFHSKHLTQADGYGHAVDLVPYLNGGLRWEWPLIFKIANAVDEASTALGVSLRWGGVWDRALNEIGGSPEKLEEAVHAYCERHPGPDFIDGPHFEIIT